MAQILNCSRGHSWDAPGDLPGEAPPASTVCPVCGETHIETDESLNDRDAPTLISDNDELPPLPLDAGQSCLATDSRTPADSSYPRVPGYTILRELGRGGMGVVYQAKQTALNRLVALKMIRGGVSAEPHEFARFRREAEAVAHLQHPNIVQIHEVGLADGLPYFSLEYVDGGSLAELLDGTPWPPQDAARLLEQLARAIHYAHERGIIHRDLKPANILLSVVSGQLSVASKNDSSRLTTDNWQLATTPKIVDFGLAKKVEASQELTGTGAIMGTPSYMAPEQAAGRGFQVAPTTDVYALGVILYELLTGRPPFRAAEPLDTLQQVVQSDPVAPRQLQPKMPRDLETICLKCLHKQPGRRYASAEGLADDLGRFQAGEPIQARPTSSWERGHKWLRRNPAKAAALAVSILAAIAFVIVILFYTRQVERGREDALRAEGEATRRAEQTRHSLKNSLVAVDKFLTRIGEMRVFFTPYMEQERIKVFQDALAFCEGFLNENREEPLAREEVGTTLIRKGWLLRLLGRFSEAEASYREAAAFFDKWENEGPAVFAFQRARALHELGNQVYWAQGMLDAASKAGQEAETILKQLAERTPDRDNQTLFGRTQHFLGHLDQARGRKKEAEEHFLLAQSLWEKLRSEFPDEPQFRLMASQTLNQLGQLLEAMHRPAEAEKALAESKRLLHRLHQEFPSEEEYASDLGTACINLGNFYSRTDRTAEAEKLYAQAKTHLERLVERQPSRPDYQNQLAMAYHNLGDSASDRKDYVAAENFLNKAMELNRKIVDRHSHFFLPFARDLALNHQNLSDVYRATLREDKAVETLRESLKILDRVVEADNKTIQYLWDHGRNAFHLAYLTWPKAQTLDTLKVFDKAVVSLESVLAKEPDHEKARQDLIASLHFRGVSRSVLGLHKESLADWTRLVPLTSGQKQQQYQVFRLRGLARVGDFAAGLAELAKLDEAKIASFLLFDLACFHARLAEDYLEKKDADNLKRGEKLAEKAIAILEQAHRQGALRSSQKMELLQRERDLRALRSRSDFQELLKRATQSPK